MPSEMIDGRIAPLTPADMLSERIALNLPDDLRIEDWQALGRKLCTMEQRVQWWIGDWWAFGEHAYGSRAQMVAEGVFGRSYGGLRNLAVVARKFEPSRRRDNLHFTHHLEVTALPTPVAEEVLNQAERERWSVRDVRAEVVRRKVELAANPVPEAPVAPLPFKPDSVTRRLGSLVRAAYCDWFGIGEARANLLSALFEAGGTPIETKVLAAAVDSHRPMTHGALHEAIHALRDAFECEAIDRDDSGYFLSEVGLAECRRALREVGTQMLVAGAEPANDTGPNRDPEAA